MCNMRHMVRSGLDRFLTNHGISNSELSRITPQLSRKHAITLRHGRGNPTERTMRRIADALSEKLGRTVTVAEAFGLEQRTAKRRAG